MLSSLRLLYLIIPSILSHRTLRYSGSHHEQISSPVAEEWFDSAGGCANYCSKTAGCGAYSTLHYGEDSAETFRGYKCQIGGESYSTTPTSSPWVLWKPKSSTNSARSVTTVSNTGKDECPVVWRMWPGDNTTLGAWSVKMSSTDGGHVGDNIMDNKNTTKARTGMGGMGKFFDNKFNFHLYG